MIFFCEKGSLTLVSGCSSVLPTVDWVDYFLESYELSSSLTPNGLDVYRLIKKQANKEAFESGG